MVITLNISLLLVSFVCFLLATLGVSSSRVNLLALGLALWVLSLIIR